MKVFYTLMILVSLASADQDNLCELNNLVNDLINETETSPDFGYAKLDAISKIHSSNNKSNSDYELDKAMDDIKSIMRDLPEQEFNSRKQ
ncbi:MAG: hypothetical protein PHV62_03550 [Sulfuricurvum sp.]|nr:hypothetical protein [Sulfuricurvum sp.]